jgi:protein-S-isoprenylcysteine O-methyltransferase Ste14
MARPLFVQQPYLSVFFGMACLLALREAVARWLWRPETETAVGSGSFGVLWATTTVGTVLAIGLPFAGVGSIGAPALAFWVGVVVMLAGFALRLASMLALGEQFSHEVAVKDDHSVVQSGPYRWVRHPSYTGAVVTYLGIGVVTGNWLSVVASLGGALVGFGCRITVEEQALREQLDDYESYVQRTPYRLVPGVW